MTRTQLRSMLRRRLQEAGTVALQWSDVTLNLYLDLGLQYLHRQIMKIDPEAIIYTATIDTVNAQRAYARPANMQRDVYVYTRATVTSSYGLLEYMPYYKVAEGVTGDGLSGYARKGRFIVLYPTPTASVSGGMQLEYIPTLSMATDAEVPDVVLDTHEAIVFRAEMLAMADAGLDAPVAEKELIVVVTDLPLYYKKTEQPQRYDQDITKWANQ